MVNPSRINRYIRQEGLVDSRIFTQPIMVIGAGGIGSFTVLTLAKMGFENITVFDMDVVDEENLGSQFYRTEDIGKFKVMALSDIVDAFADIRIKPFVQIWTAQEFQLSGVVVMAVDSMTVRKEIYGAVKRNGNVPLVVDGRMGGNQAEIYTFHNNNVPMKKAYENTLWSEGEASMTPCTEKAVMYNVLTIASFIANNIRLGLSGKPYHPKMIMDLENMMLHTPQEAIVR